VLAFPIHNWASSGQLTAFLSHALDHSQEYYKPYIAITGATKAHSHLAFDSIARAMACEVNAVHVGHAVVALGDSVNRASGAISADLDERLSNAAAALLHFTRAAIELRVLLRSTDKRRQQ
jgi:NAD(P)H-dependent FMN reductase